LINFKKREKFEKEKSTGGGRHLNKYEILSQHFLINFKKREKFEKEKSTGGGRHLNKSYILCNFYLG
jgi:hypothetical protein